MEESTNSTFLLEVSWSTMTRSRYLRIITLGFSCITHHCQSLSLSALESIAFGSRLRSIQEATRSEFRNKFSQEENDAVLPTCFIFPGAGGPDQFTSALQETIPNSIVWDWSQHRGSVATAAYDGEAVGEAVGQCLQERIDNEQIHVVGISVGAFCAHSMCDAVEDTKLTLLDPFCARGIVGGWSYGATHFGTNANESTQYLNTDDPVPSTNDPLPNVDKVVDVTDRPERATFVLPENENMHCWPTAFYAQYGYREEQQAMQSLQQQ